MIAVVLLAQLAAAVPATPPAERFELANGLRVWVQEDHTRPVVLVQVTYTVGSLHDPPGMTGVAHYVEHMVYRATQNVRNEDAYGYIDRIGGRYTGGTWPDRTQYAETVPSWALESALHVTAERMSRALFDSLEFERERSNVVTEANGFRDGDAPSALRDSVMAAAFAVHPYGHSSNTWARDNLRLTRAEAYRWYKRYYGPNNAVLVVVGDVGAADVRALVEKHFAGLPRAPGSGTIAAVEPPQRAERRITLRHRTDRRRMEIVYRAPAASDAAYPALVALNQRLAPALERVARETNADIVVRDSATAYPFVHRLSVSADTAADLERVLALIDREIDRIKAGDIAAASGSSRAGSSRRESETSNANFPARQSSLTRTADRLLEHERGSWDVGASLRDSIESAADRASHAALEAYAEQWLRTSQRTIGVLVPGRDAFAPERLDVPALKTPPARRRTPTPVPGPALQPLRPIAIERTGRVLSNGIFVRAARAIGTSISLRVVLDRGTATDSFVTAFAPERTDSALAASVRRVAAMLSDPVPAASDTSPDARARARVRSAVLPPPASAPRTRVRAVVAAGAIAPDSLASALERHFRTLPGGDVTPLADRLSEGVAFTERTPVAGARQVTIVGGLPAVSRSHPDRLALELLNYIVGVPWYGGRLGWALTKTGLTYSSAATTTFGASAGYILLATESDTRNVESVLQAIREVVAGLGDRGVEGWELREAQAFTLGRTLLYGARETSSADVLARALTGSVDAGRDLLDLPGLSRAYLAVTLADVNRVARTYYRPERLALVAVGALPAGVPARIFPAGTFRALFEP